MKKLSFIVGFSLVLAFPAAAQYAIRNVSVIPMNKDTILEDHTVIVDNGVIKTIAPSPTTRIAKRFEVVEGAGKYLIPGLIDMHTHFFSDVGDRRNMHDQELKLMLANGITTARLMTGHPSYLDLKKKVAGGAMKGPELFVASPQLAGRWHWPVDFKNFIIVQTPGQAAAAVSQFKKDGYDEIKITFMVDGAAYDAVVAKAKEEGIRVTGHVGPLVGLPAALRARQQIEHLDQFIEMLLPDTSYNHGQSVSDFNIYSSEAWATVPFLDESKIKSLAESVRNAGIFVTPTNYFMVSSFGALPADDEIRQMPDYGYIPPKLLEEKWKYRKNYRARMAPESSRQRYVYLRNMIVNELWKAGVPLMAGSDSPEYFIVAGFALHGELEAMVAAGLTPFAALETATINPASYLDISSRTGTVEVGKESDLILLSENPLTDIRNTRSILRIFNNRSSYDEQAIQTLLQEARSLGR